MEIEKFIEICLPMKLQSFFTGVPDSQLKPLCNYLIDKIGISPNHIIAANEGNCVALAAGYYLSTGNVPVVYLQNSGLGNIINPVASLLNDKVYGIPCIFIIGWRGEPGVKDEPQHAYQGEVTITLLEDMDISVMIIDKHTSEDTLKEKMKEFSSLLNQGKSVAFVVKKGGLTYNGKVEYKNNNSMIREDIIRQIVNVAGEDIIISTTGKTSRELFEIREQNNQPHKYDFLTVGSMGHSSSIALGIALNKPNSRVWCIDGDGAALMHMGAMAVIGAYKPRNLVHVVINNEAHESVGGMPTVAASLDFVKLANACGYPKAVSVDNFTDLDKTLKEAKKSEKLLFIEVKAAIGSRENLGRPTTTPEQNKYDFMSYLHQLS
ncbi:MAG TPA: phosphonopyruvate decarboxylase [Clostridiales bacterium]|nr:phosphonopyruvate decarboxylase [Clostridiales bacterium]